MSKSNNIFLVGPMGAGKTTVGRRLAELLHKTFEDSDQVIETRTGVGIPLIFELEGEAGFRQREKTVIDELTACDHLVLATGGGVVLDADNRRVLRERGVVIYLHAAIDQLLERTGKDRNRPLLQTENPRAKFEQLMQEREALYREVADISYDTGGGNLRQVVNALLGVVEQIWKDMNENSSG